MKLIYALGIAFVLAHQPANANDKAGNGADAVVSNGQVSLLDLVEHQDGFLKVEGFNYLFHRALSKINWLVSKPKKITWILTSRDLPNIEDEGFLNYRETDSEIRQVAIQKDDVVLINKPLYERMPPEHQRALVLHEVLIHTALKIGKNLNTQQGTSNIRKVTAMLMDKNSVDVPAEFIQRIWDEIPNHPNSHAALNLNRPRIESSGTSGEFLLVPTSRATFTNPLIRGPDGEYYPIYVGKNKGGPDAELTNVASRACEALGISFFYWIDAKSVDKKTVAFDTKTKRLVTLRAGEDVVSRLTCTVNATYFW
jgi:hypothetical protein